MFTAVLVFATAGVVSGEALMVDQAVEVPGIWRPDRHLYVKGDLGIPRDRLDSFADWLAAEAPNWTVVLAKNARGESFRDASGESFAGMDAVEHALGKTLPAATAFGELTHPRTGEKNGAYFILFLEERKLAYHASEAYDRRRLGEDHWIGNLDAAAIAAMRGGGRVLDAAKDTVITIDRELERRIRQEAASKARAEEQTRRAKEETAAIVAEARLRLGELEARLDVLRRDFNDPPGDLAAPPLAQWLARLDAAERALAKGDPEAATLAQSAAADIAAWIRAVFDHEAAHARLRSLGQELDEVRLHDFSVAARGALIAGREQLQAAEESHSRADSTYLQEIAAAEAQLAEALRSDRATRASNARLEQLEARVVGRDLPPRVARLLGETRDALAGGADISAQLDAVESELRRAEMDRRRAVRRGEIRKTAAITGLGMAGAALLLAAWRGNRRRRGPRSRALELFETREVTHRARSGDLLELLDRTDKAIGSAVVLERSGWTGETLRLSQQTLADVDHLFILASGLDRVLDQARQLLFPRKLSSAAVSLVSSRRYQRALELLDREPVAFSPDDPLRPVLRGKEMEPPRIFAESSRNESSFTLTFIELNENFRIRATKVIGALEVLEICWTGSERALAELEESLSASEVAERALDGASARDGLFATVGLFKTLLPAARADQEQATTTAATDPVGALGDSLARGLRRATDAAGWCELVSRIREDLIPKLDQQAQALTESGRDSHWVRLRLDELSSRGSTLVLDAVENEVSEDLQKLSVDADALAETAMRANQLAERATASTSAAMGEARRRTESERQRLGELLRVAPGEILHESPSVDPGVGLDQAAKQHAAALAGIDIGDVEAAGHALDACDRFCRRVHEILEATGEAFDAAPESFATLDQEAGRVAALAPAAASVLATLEQQWAPSALCPASADPAFPDPEVSVSDHVPEAEKLLERSRRLVAEAREKHKTGRILHAAELRREAAEVCAGAETAFAAIHSHAAAIDAVVTANAAAVAELDQQLRQLSEAVTAPQITAPTQRDFESAKDAASAAISSVHARGASANPFEAARALVAASTSLNAIGVLLHNDRKLHEEVARSLDAAEREWTAARHLAKRSQTDNIADSPEITRCLHELEAVERELVETRRRSAVPHGDWREMDERTDRVTAELARLKGRLRGELELAEQSVREINVAVAKVRAASAWGGIFGGIGSDDLEQARAVLAAGDYLAARSFASSARRKAEQAIRQAEAEAQRRRHEDERRREAARRQRRSSSSFGSSSSRSSRSSFSSGSGSSRSSFSSSSGTSRSGW